MPVKSTVPKVFINKYLTEMYLHSNEYLILNLQLHANVNANVRSLMLM